MSFYGVGQVVAAKFNKLPHIKKAGITVKVVEATASYPVKQSAQDQLQRDWYIHEPYIGADFIKYYSN